MAGAPTKLNAADLAGLLPRIEAPPAALALVAKCTAPAQAVDALEAGGFLAEAARLVACGLPHREAVWWACMCARHTAPPDRAEADSAALAAAEAWVRRPSDELRRAAFAAGQAAGFATPEAWACVAAFWSGDSMSPAGQPAVPPPPHLVATAVNGAIGLAAVRQRPERQAARLARFLASARIIAAGGAGQLEPEEA
jgi:hypothetical protein